MTQNVPVPKPKTILVLGSGALKIGQAGEFDYSGSQAIKAFKEEGIRTVLINPNIATIQTSEHLADEVYFLPVTEYFIEEVIKKEKPDAIALSFGGQTALNAGLGLFKKGILDKYGVQVLGTPVTSIEIAEDRELFAKHVREQGLSTPASFAAYSAEEALKYAAELGYPVMTRAAFALGGQSSGIIFDEKTMKDRMKDAFAFTSQVLVEQYLHHYKEVEYEVVRDRHDNCVTVCNMENFDPLGIHTGESIVVAPSQTLTNFEYHYLRQVAMQLVRSLKIVGECNVQFALNPKPDGEIEYYIIELNPRLSRSSALASKATGYPLAYVAAKLMLGKALTEVKNQMTQVTQSCFEPALDYLVVKFPRWDLDKFIGVDQRIGSGMKSVGEVMSIGRSFEEAIQKAVRMLDVEVEGVTDYQFAEGDDYRNHIERPTPRRIFALCRALMDGETVDSLYKRTGIDPWFLFRLEAIVRNEKTFRDNPVLDEPTLRELKENGFSDKYIGKMVGGKKGLEIRKIRKKLGVTPAIFKIDTLAGEFPAQANYLYVTYHGSHYDVEPVGKSGVMVLGSGPYHIGSSVEFDWTCVNAVMHLAKHGRKSIVVNCNPETVSTDYDISDRLYFEELTFERVADIYEYENPEGVIVSVGGQRPNNLAFSLSHYGFRLMGTSAEDIDRCEDRTKFSALLDELEIAQPRWSKLTTIADAKKFAEEVGYPVLVRPSYVLSGAAMAVCYNPSALEKYTRKATAISREHPVIISKFYTESKELELDAVAQNGEIVCQAISEHVEHAGVHSGDATIVFPPQRVFVITERKILDIGRKLAKALRITGPFNIQFLAKDNKVRVIEVNLRASRTFPMISKALRINFAQKIVDAMFGKATVEEYDYPESVLVKVPQFSFSRLEGADPILRVEMSSTGEVACFGDTLEEAFLKSMLSTGVSVKKKAALLSIGGGLNKDLFFDSARLLKEMGYALYATGKTQVFLSSRGIPCTPVFKMYEGKSPNVVDLIRDKVVGLVVNISDIDDVKETEHIGEHQTDGFRIRRAAVDANIPLITNILNANVFIRALHRYEEEKMEVKAWFEYVPKH
ncbi:MAG: carbamoyl-phosphate synthase (glutamine-hydrolyzing) large subunit [Patescibacteria group bacterium]|nr:carbamoyl-phosphate synthase (glutamine-hydrolyzing) large subunit [Patescibacteria group bacterium]